MKRICVRTLKTIAITLSLVVFNFAFAEVIFGDDTFLFSAGSKRLELISDSSYYERTAILKTPSFDITISTIPALRMYTLRVYSGENDFLELRVFPDAGASNIGSLKLPEKSRQLFSKLQDEISPLIDWANSIEDFAPYVPALLAVKESRGILTFNEEALLLEVNRYRQSAISKALEIIDVILNDSSAKFFISEDTQDFSIQFTFAKNGVWIFNFPKESVGDFAYILSLDDRGHLSVPEVSDALRKFLEKALPAVLVAASQNKKLEKVYRIISEKAFTIKSTKKFIAKEHTDLKEIFPPLAETDFDDVTSVYHPLNGYEVRITETTEFKRIYYFHSDGVNGFLLVNRSPDKTTISITITNDYFIAEPTYAKVIPNPAMYLTYTVTKGEKGNTFEVTPKDRVPLHKLSDENAFLYSRTRKFFEETMENETVKLLLGPEVVECLQHFIGGYGIPRGREKLETLISLSYRRKYGVSDQSILVYVDPEYHYQINLPGKKDYLSYAFSYGQNLSPEVYRFFLAPSEKSAQLVTAYPTRIPLGRTGFIFHRSVRDLSRAYGLSSYLVKYEPALRDFLRTIDKIRGAELIVSARIFMKPLPGPPYSDWLDADSLK